MCFAKWLILVCPIDPVTSGSARYFCQLRSRSSYIRKSRRKAGRSVGSVTCWASALVQ